MKNPFRKTAAGRRHGVGLLRRWLWTAALALSCQGTSAEEPARFVLFHSDVSNYQAAINGVASTFGAQGAGNVRAGVAITFNNLNNSNVPTVLVTALNAAQAQSVPVVICFDVEQYLNAHPELWNWWNPSLAGYDPANKNNVEWFGWTNASAIKISWRHWGVQTRVKPAPNLLSPEYRSLAHAQFDICIPILMDWYNRLPASKKYLFVGLKVGWESSIGTTNAVYHPNGNYYFETWPNDPSHDPAWSYDGSPPDYGFQQIGYAALATGGIKTSGSITEGDLAEVINRHLDDLTARAASLGVPRSKVFSHVQPGWLSGGLSYKAAYTPSGSPGYSCYGFADIRASLDPRVGYSVINSLANGAPGWGMMEIGTGTTAVLQDGFGTDPTCRILTYYNWNGASATLKNAVTALLSQSTVGGGGSPDSPANAGFELPATGTYVSSTANNLLVNGWAFNGPAGVQRNGSVWNAPAAPEGVQTLYLQGFNGNGRLGSVNQDVTLTGGSYQLTFKAARRNGQIQPVRVSVDGNTIATVTPTSNSFLSYAANFTVDGGRHIIALSATDASGDKTTFVDDVQTVLLTAPGAVADPSFETRPTATFVFTPADAPWTFAGTSGLSKNGSSLGAGNAADGTQIAFLQGVAGKVAGSISQCVSFPAAGGYVVKFQAARRPGYAAQPVRVSVDGVEVGTYAPAGNAFAPITTGIFTATAGTHSLTFAATDTSGDAWAFVDHVSLESTDGGSPGGFFEAEDLARTYYTTSAQGVTVISDSGASGGQYTQLNTNGTAAWVSFTVPSIAPGDYRVKVRYRSGASRGIAELSVDGVIKAPQFIDMYEATSQYKTADMGIRSFSAAGDHSFKFKVTGRNAASQGYHITIDAIELVPTLTYEAESLTRSTSGESSSVGSDASASGGQYVTFWANGAQDWISYTVPDVPAGTYTVKVRYRRGSNYGIARMQVDGWVLSTQTFDEYSASTNYATTTMGSKTWSANGNHSFKFTAWGKNGSSTGYVLTLDSIILEKTD